MLKIAVLIFVIVVTICTLSFSVEAVACQLSYGPQNAYPWLLRIWLERESRHVGLGALVTDRKVLSMCSIIPLQTETLQLVAYHYTADGRYDCDQSTPFFLIQKHKNCLDNEVPLIQYDWAVWTLPFAFLYQGQPFLLQFRPTNQEFMDAVERAKSAACEYPVFQDGTSHDSKITADKTVKFSVLGDCERAYCAGNNPSCLTKDKSSVMENVNCAFIAHERYLILSHWDLYNREKIDFSSERRWSYLDPSPRGSREQGMDIERGSVLICNGFPMGMLGPALAPGSSSKKDFRMLSSILNVVDMLKLPPKPVDFSTTIKTTPRRRRTTTATTAMTTIFQGNSNYTTMVLSTNRRRQRTTPTEIDDMKSILKTRSTFFNGQNQLGPELQTSALQIRTREVL